MKTLALRMKQHEKNAKVIVEYLSNHACVTDVLYPGQGGMISFRIFGEEAVNPFLQSLGLNFFCRKSRGSRKLYHLSSHSNTCGHPT